MVHVVSTLSSLESVLILTQMQRNAQLISLASTNINQSSPNLVKMYMTIRYRTSLIMELIEPELSLLSALELENLPYLTMFTL